MCLNTLPLKHWSAQNAPGHLCTSHLWMWHWLSEGQSRYMAELPLMGQCARHHSMHVWKRRGALQTWVHPSQRHHHCKVGAAKPPLVLVTWMLSGKPWTWLCWREMVPGERCEDPFPAWRTVEKGRNLGISLLQPGMSPKNSFRLCTPFSCHTQLGA